MSSAAYCQLLGSVSDRLLLCLKQLRQALQDLLWGDDFDTKLAAAQQWHTETSSAEA